MKQGDQADGGCQKAVTDIFAHGTAQRDYGLEWGEQKTWLMTAYEKDEVEWRWYQDGHYQR
jgi:hypothetical protein